MSGLKLKKKNLIRLAAIVCILLFFCSLIPALRKSLLAQVTRTPLAIFSFVAREAKALALFHHNYVQSEALKKQIDFLKYKLNSLEEAQIENNRLKDLLLFKQKVPFKVIAARVIGNSADNWSSVIVIDKGRYNGLDNGMAVINYLGLVGRIIEVSLNSSKIILLNDPSFAVSSIIQRSRQQGLVSGTLGNMLIMRYLPVECDIQLSDTVVTSGLGSIYPKGLLIGTVVDIGEEFSGLSRYALIKPAVDLNSLEEVLVIIR